MSLEETFDKTIRVASDLFMRSHVTGSGGNISFRDGDTIYITKSGTSFGHLRKDDFARVDIEGTILEGKPSKELPFHLDLYHADHATKAVIHTHGFHMTALSCLKDCGDIIDDLMSYTPYLKMQSGGKIAVVEYGSPGSKELFANFKSVIDPDTKVYLMRNHGATVAANDVEKAFNLIEEFETTCRLYLMLQAFPKEDIAHI